MTFQKPTAYAIDFGTSNSLLAAANATTIFDPIPLDPFAKDTTILRSVLFSPEKDVWNFGQEAIDLYTEQSNQGRLLRSLKKFLPDEGFLRTQVNGKNYTIIDLISLFLTQLRQTANTHFDTDVDTVMLGRPAAFSLNETLDNLAEKRLESAAKMAGFKHISFCPEPVAAAYDFQSSVSSEKLVLIADFGGGTSDFTILRMGKSSLTNKDVLSIGGIPLAGDAFDGSLMKHKICHHFGAGVSYKMPLGSNVMEVPPYILNKLNSPADISFLARADVVHLLDNMRRWSIDGKEAKKIEQLITLAEENLGFELYKHIEQTKKELSSLDQSHFKFQHIAGIDVEDFISAKEMVSYTDPITHKIIDKLQNVIKDAQVTVKDIDLVCLTGGTAQLKSIKDAFELMFSKEKIQQFRFFHSIIQGLSQKAREMVI